MPSAKKLWADPVWSKVIAGSILALGTAVLSTILDWWPLIGRSIARFFEFLDSSSSLPNWIIGLGAICSVLVAAVIAVVAYQIVFSSNEDTVSWRSYVSDEFMGLLWHWSYTTSGTVRNLYPCCISCDYQVYPENDSGFSAVPEIVFRCDLCGRKAGPFPEEPSQINSKAERMIHQKLRTDSWNQSAS